jgi:hypothetical protein
MTTPATPTPRGPARTLRWVAASDLAVTAAFAVPPVGAAVVRTLVDLEHRLTGRTRAYPGLDSPFTPVMGLLGVLWAAERMVRPGTATAAMDAAARVAVAGWVAHSIRRRTVPVTFAGFVATELLGGLVEVGALRRRAGGRS